MNNISDNWVIRNLENAIGTWNEKLAELWQLLTHTPESFKGGQIWGVIVNIHSALVGIGYGLLVLFFAMGLFQSATSFRELQRSEFALRHFILFVAAKVAVGYGLETTKIQRFSRSQHKYQCRAKAGPKRPRLCHALFTADFAIFTAFPPQATSLLLQ